MGNIDNECAAKDTQYFDNRVVIIQHKSAYIRKMYINGHVINLDIPQLTEISKLLRNAAINLNQIARPVNSGAEAYRNDVAEVNTQLMKINRRALLAGIETPHFASTA